MTEPWELTDEEISQALLWHHGHVLITESYRRIAAAAVKKYQEWLASKCEEKPCPQCELKDDCIEEESPGWCVEPLYREWLGQQQGYARGLEERGKHE